MKNLLVVLSILLCSTCYCQNLNVDSVDLKLMADINRSIYTELNKAMFDNKYSWDTVNSIGVYTFKFQFTERNDVELICSRMTPANLCEIVKKSIENVFLNNQIYAKKKQQYYLLPFIFQYELPMRPTFSKTITVEEILSLLIFNDDMVQSNLQNNPNLYAGIPFKGILLPILFYQTPHVSRSNKYQKVISETKQ